MRQAVMTAPGRIDIGQVNRPAPADGEVLIRIRRIGICGSDIHVYHGKHPYTSYPVVQGHEVAGVVDSTGSGVRDFGPGDRVVTMPQATCGACYPCRHGMYHVCDELKVMGFQKPGAAQDYFAINAAMALKIPDSLGIDEAAMIEPLSVAVHAVRRFGDVAGKKVAVLGAGTIGNLTAQAARALGAEKVLITDISDYRLEKARRVGLSFAVNPVRQSFAQALLDAFGHDKADLILECAGSDEAMAEAVRCARKGSAIVVVGVFPKPALVDLGLLQDRELLIAGSLMYQKADYETAIALAASGAINFDELITHRFAFDDYQAAYEAIEQARGDCMKVMIALD